MVSQNVSCERREANKHNLCSQMSGDSKRDGCGRYSQLDAMIPCTRWLAAVHSSSERKSACGPSDTAPMIWRFTVCFRCM
ncbi:uncharacterized protein MYCFIDRAFT_212724 [Pseudocercospora fijiensis CIRAD86]|uniref:Uncharacterized protein n=1 Tax=Pseudocercospora fijiensis (strain CIRAD86) TaxID=383855 RepID=M3AHL3_PSEFD|nr:uncharacterized protein MYCFIDRAFT_212724 [Pseudocercospora fijiensis CIRAD86]EME77002.1 hypothetical protein MYCFIDRAFT_212724 [Pseudocercospora fijiensis CIRAD86]